MGPQQDRLTDPLTPDPARSLRSQYETDANLTTAPHGSSPEIQRDIDRTRGAMDATLDAIGERLNPRSLFDEVVDMGRSLLFGKSDAPRSSGMLETDYTDKAKRLGSSAIDAVRDNPVPALLGGAAIAYMLFDDPVRRQYRRVYYDRYVGGLPEYSGSVVDARTGKPYDMDKYGSEYRGSAGGGSAANYAADASRRASTAASQFGTGAAKTASQAGQSVADAAGAAGHQVSAAASGAAGAVSDAAGSAAHAASSVGHSIADSAAAAANWVSETAHDVGDYVTGGAASATHYAAEQSHWAAEQSRRAGAAVGHSTLRGYTFSRDRAERAVEEYPLLVGLGCLAAGLVAGFVAPRTRPEDEWLGAQADQLRASAKHQAEELTDQAKGLLHQGEQKVAAAAVRVMDKADEKGLMPADLIDKATQTAKEAAQAAKETVHDAAKDAKQKVERTADAAAAKVEQKAGTAGQTVKTEPTLPSVGPVEERATSNQPRE